MAVIECSELTKQYGMVSALQNLTLTIEAGTSFGLLGENGAGKSTLVRLLMGFILPTSGQLRVLGETQVARVHQRIGYVPERPYFEVLISGRAYLTHFSRLIGLRGTALQRQVDALLERVHLQDAAKRSVGSYSKGMQQRLAIAQALLTDPALLILDEPTSGLDPRSQWEIRQLLQALRSEGKTIFFCSHYLAEVETLCDTIGILRRGQMILSGTVKDLVQAQNVVEIVLADHLTASSVLTTLSLPADSVLSTRQNIITIREETQASVLEQLIHAGIALHSLNPLNRSLEDVYMQATNQADMNVASATQRVRTGEK